jgi:hypothetical protein
VIVIKGASLSLCVVNLFPTARLISLLLLEVVKAHIRMKSDRSCIQTAVIDLSIILLELVKAIVYAMPIVI